MMSAMAACVFTFFILLTSVNSNAEDNVWHDEEHFLNPVLKGDYADPTVIRVEDDYYMTNSSFCYTPGLLIWHSRNLVNWRPVVYALQEYDGDIWAPELVHHEGRFYIYYYTAGPEKRGNRVVWAPQIEGPWSSPIDLKIPHIDPGHTVGPDGRRYLHLSGGHIVELAKDGLSVAGEVRKVYDGWPIPKDWTIECFCLESPKLIFKDGYYHMFSAQGGTAGPATSHMVVHARSRTPEGPWENSPLNPILRTEHWSEPWWSRGHGTVIDTPQGDWWIIYHGYDRDFYNLGRQVLLQPVEWTQDGWLRIADDSDLSQPIRRPPGKPVSDGFDLSDDFSSKKLGMQWRFWKEKDPDRIKVDDGALIMKGKGTSPGDSSPVVIINSESAYEFQVDVEIKDDSLAGLILFYNPSCYAAIALGREGLYIGHRAVMSRVGDVKVSNRARLKIRSDHHQVDFLLDADGKGFRRVGTSTEVSGYNHNAFGGFLSLRPGLFCAGQGKALFRDFQFRRLNPPHP